MKRRGRGSANAQAGKEGGVTLAATPGVETLPRAYPGRPESRLARL